MGAERVKTYLRHLPQKEPVPFEKLYPSATSDAIDLLGKMLKLDPRERSNVEEALAHKYFVKYHDVDDEPLCYPPFNFDFEETPLSKQMLKESIVKEIMDFHKEPLNLSRVPSSAKNTGTNDAAPLFTGKSQCGGKSSSSTIFIFPQSMLWLNSELCILDEVSS